MKNTYVKSFTLLLVFYILVSSAYPYSGGTGEPNDPYQIATIADWNDLMHNPSDWNDCFLLISDINLIDANVIPIGNETKKFTGIFNGDNHKVSNVYINLPNNKYVGLFGNVSNGQIKNLGVEDANISGGKYVGGLAGYQSGEDIYNCYVTGAIKIFPASLPPNQLIFDCVGGLIASSSSSTISNCYVNGDVKGRTYVGGLIGTSGRDYIVESYASGNVTSTNYNQMGSNGIGGLIGANASKIVRCYATGEVIALSNYLEVGGLVGDNSKGLILYCYSTGNVRGTSTVAGLVGYNAYNSIISNSYSVNLVTGNGGNCGGVAGMNVGAIASCYAKENILVGTNSGVISYCYSEKSLVGHSYSGSSVLASFWNKDNSQSSDGGIGITTEEMKTMTIFQNAGWAGRGWILDEGINYPRLEWENTEGEKILELPSPPLSGSGNKQNPYQIWTADDFALLSTYDNILTKHLSLEADINLYGLEISPIGKSGIFIGTFDGKGHIIRNLNINEPNSSSYSGLFSRIGIGSLIQNLRIEDINIIADCSVGGIAGYNCLGEIKNCYVKGKIRGGGVGGLISDCYGGKIFDCCFEGTLISFYSAGGLMRSANTIDSSDIIMNCYANSSIQCTSGGGLLCYSDFYIDKCHSMGSVLASNSSQYGVAYVGGLIGEQSSGGKVTNSYSTCSVSSSSLYNSYAGGLIGKQSYSSISNSYSFGIVNSFAGNTNSAYAGGLVGYQGYQTKIERCYSIGYVTANGGSSYEGGLVGYLVPFASSNVNNSFWDANSSGQNSSAGGTGKTTAEMKTLSTFTSAGWDFMGESINGPNDVWRMCKDSVDYPRLSWEFSSHGDFDCPDGTDFYDLKILADNWLMEEEHINFLDFAVFANEWHGDMKSLFEFVNQWLMPVNDIADITPGPGGDGIINMLDFAELAEYWISK